MVAYNLSERNILLSGYIKLNPGPVKRFSSPGTMIYSDSVFNSRLQGHGLRALEVWWSGQLSILSHSTSVIQQCKSAFRN